MSNTEILETIAVVIILLLIYYFSTFPQRRERKVLKKMQDGLKKGDKIVTFSGLSGVIDEVLEDRIIVLLHPDNIKISLEKWAVSAIDDRDIK